MTTTSAERDRDRLIRAAWLGAAALAFVWSIARGARGPNAWAATQAQIDCHFGFAKRCALGQGLRWVGVDVGHYADFAIASWCLLALALLLLVWRGARSGLGASIEGAALLAVFGASLAPTFLADLNGYADVPLVCLAALALATPGRTASIIGAAAAAVLGIVIHEGYLLLLLPVTLLPIVQGEPGRPVGRSAWLAAGAIGFGAGLLAVALALESPMTPHLLAAIEARARAGADFALRPDVFDVLRRSLADNFAVVAAEAHQSWWPRYVAFGAIATLPGLALFYRLLWRGWPGVTRLVRAAATAAVAAPLAVNPIGWDTIRWDMFVLIDAFLAACALARAFGPPRLSDGERRYFLLAASALAAVQLVAGAPLIDGHLPRFTLLLW